MAILETQTGVAYSELIAGPEKEIFTKNGTLKTGENVEKGALLSLDTGKYVATALAGTAVAVATEAVDATSADKTITVFTSGYFNREKLIAASGDTVTAHEEELRSVGIYLSSLK